MQVNMMHYLSGFLVLLSESVQISEHLDPCISQSLSDASEEG